MEGAASQPELANRRSMRLVVAGAVFIVAAILGLTGIILWQLRQNAEANAEAGITKLDRVLAEEAEQVFQSADNVMSGIVGELRNAGINSAERFRHDTSGPEFYEALRQRLAGLPQVATLTLIDANGGVPAGSGSYPPPQVNVADRDYFIALRDHPEMQRFISEPVLSRATGNWTIYMARRVASPEGTFIGIVLAGIELKYLENFYREVNPGAGGSIALWRVDGILLVRHPVVADTVGRAFAGSRYFKDIVAVDESGFARIMGEIDRKPRIIAVRRLRQFPLLATVGLDRDEVFASWRSQAIVVAVSGVIASIAIALIAWALLLRQFATYGLMARQRAQIASETEARRLLEVALESETAALQELRASQERERELERQLLHSQKIDALGTLAGGMAHDLNNTLMPILALSKLVMEEVAPGSAAHEDLETIVRASEQARDLVQRILTFSRKQEMVKRQVDLAAVTQEALRMLRPTLPATIDLVERIAEVPKLLGDPGQLQQLIVNLVTNAVQALGNRRGTVTIAVSPSPAGQDEREAIRLVVTDTGCGMDEATLNRIFEPFFTTKNVGEGTGLGLSAAHGIVTGHGGRIAVRSLPGQGAEFTVLLPAYREDEAVVPAEQATD